MIEDETFSEVQHYINVCIYMIRKHLSLFCCWKYPETLIILVKLIGQWNPDGKGRGIARNIWKKIILMFKIL